MQKIRCFQTVVLKETLENSLDHKEIKQVNPTGNLCLIFNIQKTKIMACSPITSWQIEGEKVEAVTDFLFGGSKITVDGDCSHEIKGARSLEG